MQQIQQAKMFLDEKMPVVSGRNWRILNGDISTLYETYAATVPNPVGKTYFCLQILKKENIHRMSLPSICPYCSNNLPNSRKGSG